MDRIARVGRFLWLIAVPSTLILLWVVTAVRGSDFRLARGVEDAVLRLLEGVRFETVIAVIAGYFAVQVFASLTSPPTEEGAAKTSAEDGRFAFSRHWGGLGSGEGGWEVDRSAARFFLRAIAAASLAMLSALLFLTRVEPQKAAPATGGDAGTAAGATAQSETGTDAAAAPPQDGGHDSSQTSADGGPKADATVAPSASASAVTGMSVDGGAE